MLSTLMVAISASAELSGILPTRPCLLGGGIVGWNRTDDTDVRTSAWRWRSSTLLFCQRSYQQTPALPFAAFSVGCRHSCVKRCTARCSTIRFLLVRASEGVAGRSSLSSSSSSSSSLLAFFWVLPQVTMACRPVKNSFALLPMASTSEFWAMLGICAKTGTRTLAFTAACVLAGTCPPGAPARRQLATGCSGQVQNCAPNGRAGLTPICVLYRAIGRRHPLCLQCRARRSRRRWATSGVPTGTQPGTFRGSAWVLCAPCGLAAAGPTSLVKIALHASRNSGSCFIAARAWSRLWLEVSSQLLAGVDNTGWYVRSSRKRLCFG